MEQFTFIQDPAALRAQLEEIGYEVNEAQMTLGNNGDGVTIRVLSCRPPNDARAMVGRLAIIAAKGGQPSGFATKVRELVELLGVVA